MHIPRRHLNYANVVATLALVFAMSGGALAAKHYLINSTKQIKPSVLKSLKGNTGKTGPGGPAGSAGPAGPGGSAGPAGSAVAFAYVTGSAATPTLTSAKNVSAVSRVTTAAKGEYCISVTVPFQNITGITDPGFGGGNGVTVSANLTVVPTFVAGGACPAGTSVIVLTGDEKELKSANFWISFD
jgi:hypothetical protein